jgi:hypothetical protein
LYDPPFARHRQTTSKLADSGELKAVVSRGVFRSAVLPAACTDMHPVQVMPPPGGVAPQSYPAIRFKPIPPANGGRIRSCSKGGHFRSLDCELSRLEQKPKELDYYGEEAE